MDRRTFLRRSGMVTGGALAGAAGTAAIGSYVDTKDAEPSGHAVGHSRPRGLRATTLTYRVETTVPAVALTFDDGPSTRFTSRILDALESEDAQATFYLIGSHVAALPAVTRRIAERHEVGNHTWSHPNLSLAHAGSVERQLRRAHEEIGSASGRAPTTFRPPYGYFSGATAMVAVGMTYPMVLWDAKFDVRRSASANARRLGDVAGPGSILLAHDGGLMSSDMVASALPELIRRLRARGLRLVTVSELLSLTTASPGTGSSTTSARAQSGAAGTVRSVRP